MNFKQEMNEGLQEIRDELCSDYYYTGVILTDNRGKMYQVKDAIVFGATSVIDNRLFYSTDEIQINILSSTFAKLNMPRLGYTKANYNYEEYNLTELEYSTWDTVKRMRGKKISIG